MQMPVHLRIDGWHIRRNATTEHDAKLSRTMHNVIRLTQLFELQPARLKCHVIKR